MPTGKLNFYKNAISTFKNKILRLIIESEIYNIYPLS
jgi:hypothetical protein